ncbi:hypothetical protein ACFPLB_14380 [Aquamicrobium segne]|uniref:Transposase n=1 Tax=Aquamicrobium segne TaxID=469547 RepID=A0ABW0H143_9HYPH
MATYLQNRAETSGYSRPNTLYAKPASYLQDRPQTMIADFA